MNFRRAWDGNDPRLLSEQPRERDLRRRRLLPFRDRLCQIDDDLIRFTSFGCEAGNDVAEVRTVEGRVLVDLPRKKTSAERTERNEANTEFFARWQDIRFARSPPKRILTLNRRHGLY